MPFFDDDWNFDFNDIQPVQAWSCDTELRCGWLHKDTQNLLMRLSAQLFFSHQTRDAQLSCKGSEVTTLHVAQSFQFWFEPIVRRGDQKL
ncbi:hypothetical protein BPAE_0056g00290 [Botrytis paeoniae]|uniref:Uncharacterized protein n=1 Tax=Botrytis paeoniae TaxID=278948 RepID=A0A4Z1FSK2_9HELO|nr:hypothetical protein BPAE_0056g00290 [Botrytis paeoniae]